MIEFKHQTKNNWLLKRKKNVDNSFFHLLTNILEILFKYF